MFDGFYSARFLPEILWKWDKIPQLQISWLIYQSKCQCQRYQTTVNAKGVYSVVKVISCYHCSPYVIVVLLPDYTFIKRRLRIQSSN